MPNIPHSIGVIMDGNRRWARSRGLPQLEGHRAGAARLKEVTWWAQDAGVRYLTVYAFSSENWNRPPEEVKYLMGLLKWFLSREIGEFEKHGTRLRVIGERERVPPDLRKLIEDAEEKTAKNEKGTLVICLSYGGRPEIISAARKLIAAGVSPDSLTEEVFSDHLWTSGMPDPDLIIRTGGVMRLSNFLPWQSVYAELFFTETLWPDFSKEEFEKILSEYETRERRFGK